MQKPTKAFADMVLELADRLEAVLNEVYGGAGLIPVFVSPESLRDMAREFMPDAERGQLAGDSTYIVIEVTRREPAPTPEIPNHLVCEDHEDHNFRPVGWSAAGGA